MPVTLAAPAAPMSRVPALAVLARIVDEVELDDGVRVAGELVRGRFLTPALADALHARYFRGLPGLSARKVPWVGVEPGRRGVEFRRRLTEALHPDLLRRDGWRFAYRTVGGVPSFTVATGAPAGQSASCFLHLQPASAPEVFARFVGALDGYDIPFSAELAGDPAACLRRDGGVVTVARDDVPTVVRAALRIQQRVPLALAASAPAFTRRLAPGIAVADEPAGGPGLGRHRCALVAEGLVAAGRGAPPAARRAAVLERLARAGLDPAALHLEPGNPDFRV